MKTNFKTAFLIILLALNSCHDSHQITVPDGSLVEIHLKYGFDAELNTFDSTYQTGLMMDGSAAKAKFILTPEEKKKIFLKAIEVGFYELKDSYPNYEISDYGTATVPQPGEQLLRIKYNQYDKTVTWHEGYDEKKHPELKPLRIMVNFIQDLLESKPEYKDVPMPGYLYM